MIHWEIETWIIEANPRPNTWVPINALGRHHGSFALRSSLSSGSSYPVSIFLGPVGTALMVPDPASATRYSVLANNVRACLMSLGADVCCLFKAHSPGYVFGMGGASKSPSLYRMGGTTSSMTGPMAPMTQAQK